MQTTTAALVLALALPAGALESNAYLSPQYLDTCDSAQGRTAKCEVQLDVPAACVGAGGRSDCPVVFFLHGGGGRNDGYARSSGVHDAGMIGVYPEGENGWNTGPKDSNDCDWDDFDCASDPDEGAFVAAIVADLRALGADGNVYMNGSSNGAALAHRIAANAGDELPVRGIITRVTQLLASPPRSGPGVLNYNQPRPGGPAVSVLNLMGTADGVIPYEGGTAGVLGGHDPDFVLMSATDSMAEWAEHNGCASASPVVEDVSYSTNADPNGVATFMAYGGCPEGVIVEHYALIGAGHGFGAGAALGGVGVQDLAFQFIQRLEGGGGGGGDGGGGGGGGDGDSSSNDGPCEDDPDWSGKMNAAHTCEFVGSNPERRCRWESSDGVLASVACKLSCGACGTPAPMPTPPAPTPPAPTSPPPTTAPRPCADDLAWHGKHSANHDCAYVAQRPQQRCRWESAEGVRATDACQSTCDTC